MGNRFRDFLAVSKFPRAWFHYGTLLVIARKSVKETMKKDRNPGELPCERGVDVRRKIWIIPRRLKETNLGVDHPFLSPKRYCQNTSKMMFYYFFAYIPKRYLYNLMAKHIAKTLGDTRIHNLHTQERRLASGHSFLMRVIPPGPKTFFPLITYAFSFF